MTLIHQGGSDGKGRSCNARCYNGKHARCRCICGGGNHGVGLAQAEANTAAMAERIMESGNEETRSQWRAMKEALQGRLKYEPVETGKSPQR